jgi:hypothetical protein
MNQSKTTFSVLYDQFVASIGSGIPITENRKNCVLNFRINVPQGFQFSVTQVDFRGYARLESGVNGLQKVIYYESGSVEQFTAQSSFRGPMEMDYVLSDRVGMLTWSDCGKSINYNVNAQVRLDKGMSNGQGVLSTGMFLMFSWLTMV